MLVRSSRCLRAVTVGHNSVGDYSSLEGETLRVSLSLLTYKFGGQAGTSGGLITHGARGHGPVESSSD